MLTLIASISCAMLFYIYFGYKYFLKFLLLFVTPNPQTKGDVFLKKVTVLLTVRNEEATVWARIESILNQDYPPELLEVLVASDGSTDLTNDIVSKAVDPRVRLFVSTLGLGKTVTQNEAVKTSSGEIVIFTDAGSSYKSDFIKTVVSAFADGSVGAVDGHLLFLGKKEDQIARSQGYYWRYELALREAESRLGVLAVASGACLAVRRELLCEMNPSIGEDCIVPLDVVAQGYKVVHAADALAYDVMESDPERELRSRIRMTLRNWQGTWSRPQLLNPFVHPEYAFSLWSHKLLRWLSPFFLIALTFCLIFGTLLGDLTMQMGLGVMAIIYLFSLLGWCSEKWHWRIPFAFTAYSFMLANAGFLVGVTKALLGHRIYKYR